MKEAEGVTNCSIKVNVANVNYNAYSSLCIKLRKNSSSKEYVLMLNHVSISSILY